MHSSTHKLFSAWSDDPHSFVDLPKVWPGRDIILSAVVLRIPDIELSQVCLDFRATLYDALSLCVESTFNMVSPSSPSELLTTLHTYFDDYIYDFSMVNTCRSPTCTWCRDGEFKYRKVMHTLAGPLLDQIANSEAFVHQTRVSIQTVPKGTMVCRTWTHSRHSILLAFLCPGNILSPTAQYHNGGCLTEKMPWENHLASLWRIYNGSL